MIIDLIRDATRTSHRRLDLALSWLDLGKPRYYAAFLRGQAEALFPLEAALERDGIARILPDWPQRARTAALEDDLIAMDVGCAPLAEPQFDGAAEMLGAVYVLEATRVSARAMLSRLAEYPDSDSIDATKYLRHGFGKRLWPSFLDVLETHPATLADPPAAVRGANIAFDMFENALVPIVSTAAE